MRDSRVFLTKHNFCHKYSKVVNEAFIRKREASSLLSIC
jgi:hypothetical protein